MWTAGHRLKTPIQRSLIFSLKSQQIYKDKRFVKLKKFLIHKICELKTMIIYFEENLLRSEFRKR